MSGSNRFPLLGLRSEDLLKIERAIRVNDQASVEVGQCNRVDMDIGGVIADVETTQIERLPGQEILIMGQVK